MNKVEENLKTDVKVIFTLTLVHFTGDFYSAFIIPLLPTFVEKLSLSLTQVGLLTGINHLMAFIVQPLAGYLADHYRTRSFVFGGLIISIVFIPLVGIAPSFLVLLFFITLGSIGSSMYHPQCAGLISNYAGRHFNFSMSVFNTGGTFAFGLGPIFITFFVSSYGLEATPYTMVLGLAVIVFLFKSIPIPEGEGLANLGFIGSIRDVMGATWKPIVMIWIVMVLRAYTTQSFLTFVPVMYAQEGHSIISIGAIVSLFIVAGAISGLIAGYISDRVGYKPVFYISLFLTTPSLFLLLYLKGYWVYFTVFLAGFILLSTLPLGVAMAQELAPRGRSMVSSLMMGLAYGTGGMMAPITGKLSDIFSIRPVLSFIAMVPLFTMTLIYFLPNIKPRSYR